jgi:hypothetical protein
MWMLEPTNRILLNKLAEKVEECDAMIALVGFSYGGAAHNPGDFGFPDCSCTQFEVLFAEQIKMPIYYWMASDSLRQEGQIDPRQMEFRQRIEGNGIERTDFDDERHLDLSVRAFLKDRPWQRDWRVRPVSVAPPPEPTDAVGLVVVPAEQRILGNAFSVAGRQFLATTKRVAEAAAEALDSERAVAVWWRRHRQNTVSELELALCRDPIGLLRIRDAQPAGCDLPLAGAGRAVAEERCSLLLASLETEGWDTRDGAQVQHWAAGEWMDRLREVANGGLDGAPLLDLEGRVVAILEGTASNGWTPLRVEAWRDALPF